MGYMYEAPEQFSEAPEAISDDVSESEMGYYGEAPDLNGYGADPEVGYFAEDPIAGYVREGDSRHSPRVVPVDKIGGFDGFYTPKSKRSFWIQTIKFYPGYRNSAPNLTGPVCNSAS